MTLYELLPTERRWLREDPNDPRPHCPKRDQHAIRMYGDRWEDLPWAHPRLDGKSVQRTHKQFRCDGCKRFMVWLPRSANDATTPDPVPSHTGEALPDV